MLVIGKVLKTTKEIEMSECPTMQIKQKLDGRIRIINVSDFNPEIHDDKIEPAAKVAKAAKPSTTSEPTPSVEELLGIN